MRFLHFSGRRKVQNSSQLKVTKMLLIVSTVFVCLNLPSCLLRIETYWEVSELLKMLTQITYMSSGPCLNDIILLTSYRNERNTCRLVYNV